MVTKEDFEQTQKREEDSKVLSLGSSALEVLAEQVDNDDKTSFTHSYDIAREAVEEALKKADELTWGKKNAEMLQKNRCKKLLKEVS